MNRLLKTLRSGALSLLGLKSQQILVCENGESTTRTIVLVS